VASLFFLWVLILGSLTNLEEGLFTVEFEQDEVKTCQQKYSVFQPGFQMGVTYAYQASIQIAFLD